MALILDFTAITGSMLSTRSPMNHPNPLLGILNVDPTWELLNVASTPELSIVHLLMPIVALVVAPFDKNRPMAVAAAVRGNVEI